MGAPWEKYAPIVADDVVVHAKAMTPEEAAAFDASPASGPWQKYSDKSSPDSAKLDSSMFERVFNAENGAKIVRQVGLTARAALRGVTAIPSMIGDAVGLHSSEGTDTLGDMMYLPRPETTTERVVGDVSSAMAGSGGTMGLGKMMYNGVGDVVKGVGNMFRSEPLLQTISAATGGGAASVTRESGGGPLAQMAAGLGGAFAPGAARVAGAEGLRQMMRGGEEGRQVVQGNLRDFSDAGYGTPSAGQASEQRFPRAVESVLSKTPGSAGRMAAGAEKGTAGLGQRVEDLANELSNKATSAEAGKKISDSVQGFKEGFKELQGTLYQRLDQYMPKDTPVDVSATKAALAKLNEDIPGAPNLSKWFKNEKIQGIDAALSKDLEAAEATGKLPYEAIKKLRTLVGGELADHSLMADVPKSKWSALYGALSDDLGVAAKTAGPDATKAWEWANQFTKSQLSRLEQVSSIVGKDAPEKIFQAAMSGTKEGATNLKATIDMIPKDARKTVAATVLRRMGLATPGKQDDLGEAFSGETFLTNWNRLSPEAKTTLFDRLGGDYRSSLDQVAKVANNLREGSKVYANPSGTGAAVSAQVPGYAALVALVTGHPVVAAAVGSAPLAANSVARLMTNKKFVTWLSEATTGPAEAIPAQLNTLANISEHMNADDRKAVNEYMEKARKIPKTAQSR